VSRATRSAKNFIFGGISAHRLVSLHHFERTTVSSAHRTTADFGRPDFRLATNDRYRAQNSVTTVEEFVCAANE